MSAFLPTQIEELIQLTASKAPTREKEIESMRSLEHLRVQVLTLSLDYKRREVAFSLKEAVAMESWINDIILRILSASEDAQAKIELLGKHICGSQTESNARNEVCEMHAQLLCGHVGAADKIFNEHYVRWQNCVYKNDALWIEERKISKENSVKLKKNISQCRTFFQKTQLK